MPLQSRLEEDLKCALRDGLGLKKTTLRLVLTEIKVESVAQGRALNDQEIVQVLRKQVQMRGQVQGGEAQKVVQGLKLTYD